MRYLIFSLMLAAAAHAITCTEGLFLYIKDKDSYYLNETDAIIDNFYSDYIDSDEFESQKFIREQDRLIIVYELLEQGEHILDTIVFYQINDINSPVENSIAYKKSTLGDTTLIEAILTETGTNENEPNISQVRMKFFKNGMISDVTEVTKDKDKIHSETFLRNDTLFVYNITSSNDTVGYFFYINDKDDSKTCHAFTKMQADPGSNDREIVENTDRIYKVEETDTGFVLKKIRETRVGQTTMVYTEGRATTSIAKRPAARMKQPSRDYYFDTKGRKQFKAIPYRVQF